MNLSTDCTSNLKVGEESQIGTLQILENLAGDGIIIDGHVTDQAVVGMMEIFETGDHMIGSLIDGGLVVILGGQVVEDLVESGRETRIGQSIVNVDTFTQRNKIDLLGIGMDRLGFGVDK